jgi:hypothetical protein
MHDEHSNTGDPAVGSTRFVSRRKRPKVGSPDAASGAVSCLSCLMWPSVYRMRSSGIWTAGCVNPRCNSTHTCTADTREQVIKLWNERNERLHIFG